MTTLCGRQLWKPPDEGIKGRNERERETGDGERSGAISISCPAICSCNLRWNGGRERGMRSNFAQDLPPSLPPSLARSQSVDNLARSPGRFPFLRGAGSSARLSFSPSFVPFGRAIS